MEVFFSALQIKCHFFKSNCKIVGECCRDLSIFDDSNFLEILDGHIKATGFFCLEELFGNSGWTHEGH